MQYNFGKRCQLTNKYLNLMKNCLVSSASVPVTKNKSKL